MRFNNHSHLAQMTQINHLDKLPCNEIHFERKHRRTLSLLPSSNMTERTKAKITSNSGKSYTNITFLPDYQRFDMNGLYSTSYSKKCIGLYCLYKWKRSSGWFSYKTLRNRFLANFDESFDAGSETIFVYEKKERKKFWRQIFSLLIFRKKSFKLCLTFLMKRTENLIQIKRYYLVLFIYYYHPSRM
jgi:hypothetical protein